MRLAQRVADHGLQQQPRHAERRAGEQQGGRQEVQQVVQHRALGGIGETEIQVQRPP